ncbi:MAG: hypothetical protein BWZ00_01764 [Bacteroidetes bacterium ADurb.BinA174]|nr:MAG: hypothetical protein BWZ00_01764 [Bacteroidetes bacterium ADurb.BinA174]
MLLQLISLSGIQAQENLKISTIFEKYGKQKGSTMVLFSGEALNNYKLDKYRSITLPYDKNTSKDIQQCLEADKKSARKIKEVISSGIISSGYYQLLDENNHINRYILFKIGNDGIATLIYMEGGKDSEELINKLFIKNK